MASGEPGRSAARALPGLSEPLGEPGRAPGVRLRYARGAAGIEGLTAALRGHAFAPHRHDCYAVGVTLAGVQTFVYRGERRVCLPGDVHVLHPDELHDGAAGTDEGFAYRIVYLDPVLVGRALGHGRLPFVADPVVARAVVDPTVLAALKAVDEPLGGLEAVEVGGTLAAFLQGHAASVPAGRPPLPLDALRRVRDLIADDPAADHGLATLEGVAGLDRWTLARRFREAFGTSPSRFRTMRRLDLARNLVREGRPLAEAALEAGFADQSHLTRMFKRAYGLTPGRWLAALR